MKPKLIEAKEKSGIQFYLFFWLLISYPNCVKIFLIIIPIWLLKHGGESQRKGNSKISILNEFDFWLCVSMFDHLNILASFGLLFPP